MTVFVGPIEFASSLDAKQFCDLNNLSQTFVDNKPLTLRKIDAMKTMNLPCQTIDVIDDKLIISRLPVYIMEMLGKEDGSGFDLNTNRRDLFFDNGRVSYILETHSIKIDLD